MRAPHRSGPVGLRQGKAKSCSRSRPPRNNLMARRRLAFTPPQLCGPFRELEARRNERRLAHPRVRGIPASTTHGNDRTAKRVGPSARSGPVCLRPDCCENEKTVLGGGQKPCRNLDWRISKTSLISPKQTRAPLATHRWRHDLRCLKNSTCRSRFMASSSVSYGPPKFLPFFDTTW